MPLVPEFLKMRWQEVEALWRNQNHHGSATPALLRAVLVEVQAFLEELLDHIDCEYPAADVWKVLSGGGVTARDHNRMLLEAKAASLGLAIPLPGGLVAVEREQVRSASEKHRGALRARIIAVLLVAAVRQDHPLRSMGRQDPTILSRWDKIASMRNRIVHGGAKASRADAEGAFECACHTLRMFAQIGQDAA
jgi:hypothetical protein